MKNTNIFKILFVTGVVFLTTTLFAWDGQRQGFILGGGFGGSVTSFTQDVDYSGTSETSDRENKVGVATDFRIGYAFTNQFLLYYMSKGAWFSAENSQGDEVTFLSTLGPIGISYYFTEESPSLYVTLGAGFTSWYAPFEDEQDIQGGAGFFIGLGYEFIEHVSIEVDIMVSNTSMDEDGVETSTNSTSILVYLQVLGF